MIRRVGTGGSRPPAPWPPPGSRAASQVLRWSWSISPALTILAVLAVATLALSIVGHLVDDRLLLGVSVWNKPAKFAISFCLWAPTMVGIYSLVHRGWLLRGCLEILGWSMILELILITMQAGRGVPSHYNYETAFDGAVFTAMAAGVGTMTVVAIVAGAFLARAQLGSTALGLSVKIAVPVMTSGAVLGYIMTSPREGQIESGGNTFGGHTIGASDGGPGVPLLGWSTEFGDLRVAHFVGLHALQALPLIALLLERGVRAGRLRLSQAEQRSVVVLGAIAYVGLIGVTLWQALRGQPVIGPDQLTLTVAAVVVGTPVLFAFPTLYRGRRRATTDLPATTFEGIGPDDLAG
jgi:hypothetical protein